MRWFRRRRAQEPVWCQGCGRERPVCCMNWDSVGQYRCRQCNPDPGIPHDSQTASQRARSLRYAAAIAGTAKPWRCTECGRRLRKSVWHPAAYMADDAHRAEAELLAAVLKNAELCVDCVGSDPFARGWIQMDIVSY